MISVEDRQRVQTACLAILVTIAVGAAMYWLRPVLIPFVLAVFLASCLTPIIDAQMRHLRLPWAVAFVGAVLVGCGVLAACGLIVTAAIEEIIQQGHLYQSQVEKVFHRVVEPLPLERVGVDREHLRQSILHGLRGAATNTLTGAVGWIMSVVSNGVLVLIFMVFILFGRTRPTAPRDGVQYQIELQMKRYLLSMLFMSALTGMLVGGVLAILHVPSAWLFGFLAFVLNFIPNIGSVVATLLPLPMVLLSPDLSAAAKILAFALPMGVQTVLGNFVQPRVMGRSLDLSPVTILLALIFFGEIWGLAGMFLATPITAIVKILIESFAYTRPLATLLAGRPPGPAHSSGSG